MPVFCALKKDQTFSIWARRVGDDDDDEDDANKLC